MKKGTFIRISYIAKTKANNRVFDKAEINIISGARYVIPGLDETFEKHEVGDNYTVIIPPIKAFGKRNSNLLKLIPISEFKKQKISPVPGLMLTINDKQGIVRSVSGGRVIVDFNNPLAGKEVIYDVKILKEIRDTKEKIETIINARLGLPKTLYTIVTGKKNKIIIKGINKEMLKYFEKIINKDLKEYANLKIEVEAEKIEAKNEEVKKKERTKAEETKAKKRSKK